MCNCNVELTKSDPQTATSTTQVIYTKSINHESLRDGECSLFTIDYRNSVCVCVCVCEFRYISEYCTSRLPPYCTAAVDDES